MIRITCGLLICSGALAATETASEIMARVAANQDQAQELRSRYRFHQNVLVRVQRANGKLAREETRDYRVIPTEKGAKRELLHLSGKVLNGNKTIPFTETDFRYKGVDIDGEIVTEMMNDVGRTEPKREEKKPGEVHASLDTSDDKKHSNVHIDLDTPEDKTRDGIDQDLFPLSTKQQRYYNFKLEGDEEYHEHQVYRITFTPKKGEKEDDKAWAGEALIDKVALQPVLITTHLTVAIPTAVKIMLGTNIQHVGFKVAYAKFPGDVWFPVSYGGELRFRVLFMYARRVSLGLINSEFERADVQSKVEFEMPEAK